MITVGAFCNRRTVIAKPTETLREISQRMRDEHVGSVVVVEERGDSVTPIGLLTDRDIVTRALAEPTCDVASTQVGEIMSDNMIKAWEEEDLNDILKRMRSFGIRRVPVVDRTDNLQGIITFDDILDFLQEQFTDIGTLLSRERMHESQAKSR